MNPACSALLPVTVALTLAATGAAQVVINEVSYDAPGSDDGQVFVEIHGPANFDVSGYTLQAIEGRGTSASTCNNETFTFPPGTRIPADGFLVVADADPTGVTQVPNADFLVADMDLENGPDALQLLDANGIGIDAVAYGPVNTNVGTASTCNGQPWFEGNPARDVFAPLSIERCPPGVDTNDNDTDFVANDPTPGTGSACCGAIEWVNQGSGNSISAASGTIGFDFFLKPCGANQNYLLLAAITDPAVVPPPFGLPVFDATTSFWIEAALLGGPFVNWAGTLGPDARSVGQAGFDFATAPVVVSASFQVWIGAVAYDASFNISSTNSVTVTINP